MQKRNSIARWNISYITLQKRNCHRKEPRKIMWTKEIRERTKNLLRLFRSTVFKRILKTYSKHSRKRRNVKLQLTFETYSIGTVTIRFVRKRLFQKNKTKQTKCVRLNLIIWKFAPADQNLGAQYAQHEEALKYWLVRVVWSFLSFSQINRRMIISTHLTFSRHHNKYPGEGLDLTVAYFKRSCFSRLQPLRQPQSRASCNGLCSGSFCHAIIFFSVTN